VPTPDDVSEEDIGTEPETDAAEDAEEAESDTEEPVEEESLDDEQAEPEGEDEEQADDDQIDEEETEDDEQAEAEEDRQAEDEVEPEEAAGEDKPDEDEPEEDEPKSLEKGLEKTREGLIDQLSALFTGDSIDEEIVEEVEEVLIKADVGPKVTQKILDAIGEQLEGEDKNDPSKVWGFIRQYTRELLEAHEGPMGIDDDKPFVILVVGVNGVGKTTSIGKMASKFKKQGKSVLLVAGDTFRAAAVDQLGIWAERTGLPMHSGEEGADPASVIYDGIERGIDEDIDVVICDTSGRLHTDKNLMEELKKMERVAGNAKEGAPHEVNLVLDANTGQNALAQAEKFFDALDVTGITLTKFDGTARGGVILGVCDRFDAPVRYVGIGERVVDLREFDADEFVEALFM
jgi:fused signal recognition particle receptor